MPLTPDSVPPKLELTYLGLLQSCQQQRVPSSSAQALGPSSLTASSTCGQASPAPSHSVTWVCTICNLLISGPRGV